MVCPKSLSKPFLPLPPVSLNPLIHDATKQQADASSLDAIRNSIQETVVGIHHNPFLVVNVEYRNIHSKKELPNAKVPSLFGFPQIESLDLRPCLFWRFGA